MFKLTIQTDNDAFQPTPAYELARILRHVAARLDSGEAPGKVFDINGNSVGRVEFLEDNAS